MPQNIGKCVWQVTTFSLWLMKSTPKLETCVGNNELGHSQIKSFHLGTIRKQTTTLIERTHITHTHSQRDAHINDLIEFSCRTFRWCLVFGHFINDINKCQLCLLFVLNEIICSKFVGLGAVRCHSPSFIECPWNIYEQTDFEWGARIDEIFLFQIEGMIRCRYSVCGENWTAHTRTLSCTYNTNDSSLLWVLCYCWKVSMIPRWANVEKWICCFFVHSARMYGSRSSLVSYLHLQYTAYNTTSIWDSFIVLNHTPTYSHSYHSCFSLQPTSSPPLQNKTCKAH